MPVMVRNNQPGCTTLADTEGVNRFGITWQGKGDKAGQDIQMVSDDVANHPAFHRAVQKGVLTIIDEEEAKMAFASQSQQWAQQQTAQQVEAAAVLDPSSNQDLLMVNCLISNEPVAMKVSDLGKVPPLADRFAHLASQFTPIETAEFTADGKAVVKWVQVEMGEPVSDQSDVVVQVPPS